MDVFYSYHDYADYSSKRPKMQIFNYKVSYLLPFENPFSWTLKISSTKNS